MVGPLYYSSRYLIPTAMLYLYKSPIRSKMEYGCHNWTCATESSLSSLDGIQKQLRSVMDYFPP